MLAIGLGYRSGHGKDTLANFMVEWFREHTGEFALRRGLSWQLKRVSEQLYGHLGLKPPEFYDTDYGRSLRNVKLPRIGLTPVEIWIKVGQTIRNEVWEHTWVEHLIHNATADVLLIPDIRLPLEIGHLDFSIHVHNPRIPDREGMSIDDLLKDFRDWNFQVVNDGSKEQLRDKANQLCREIVNFREHHEKPGTTLVI